MSMGPDDVAAAVEVRDGMLYVLQKLYIAAAMQEVRLHSVRRMVGNNEVIMPETNAHVDGAIGMFEPGDTVGLLYNAPDMTLYIIVHHGTNTLFTPFMSKTVKKCMSKLDNSFVATIEQGMKLLERALREYASSDMENETILDNTPHQIQ